MNTSTTTMSRRFTAALAAVAAATIALGADRAEAVSPATAVASAQATTITGGTASPVAAASPTGPAPYTGGQTAQPGEFAFVAGIRTVGEPRFFCTGSLVHPQWILTAAHCVDGGMTPGSVEVVVGDTDLDTATDPAETRFVDQIVVHPKWKGKTAGQNDVAMLHLTAPSTMPTIIFGVPKSLKKGLERCNQMKLMAAGPASWAIRSMPCPIGAGLGLGWGRTSSSATTTSSTLKKAAARVFDMGPKTFWRVKSGACPGDSGGPLVVRREDGVLLQIGVASYNQHGGGYFDWLVGGRCSPKGYDFYSNVGAGGLLTWFEGVMA